MALSPESMALAQAAVDESPPLTAAQLSRISTITGLVPVDLDVRADGNLGGGPALCA
jgi:hypothetical protein